MAVAVQITKWACVICGAQYDTTGEAGQCERKHERSRNDEQWDKLFPQRHSDDTRWKYHCVDCGTRLVQFEYEPDPTGPAGVGSEVWKIDRGFRILLDGRRCVRCHEHRKADILDWYWFYYGVIEDE